MSEKDGGPAYPQLGRCDHDVFDDVRGGMVREERLLTNGGMSLRDYFAGQALVMASTIASARFTVNPSGFNVDEALLGVASTAYMIADAMLAERAK